MEDCIKHFVVKVEVSVDKGASPPIEISIVLSKDEILNTPSDSDSDLKSGIFKTFLMGLRKACAIYGIDIEKSIDPYEVSVIYNELAEWILKVHGKI